MQGQQPDLSNVDLSKATTMRCENCEGATFKQSLMLHRLSALVSPNGQETIIPTAVFACEGCGHVNDDFVKMTRQ